MKIKRISVGKIMVIIIAGLFVLYTIEGFGTKSEISSYLEKRCDEPVEVSFFGWWVTAKWKSNGRDYYTHQDAGLINGIKDILKDNIVIRDVHIRISNSDGQKIYDRWISGPELNSSTKWTSKDTFADQYGPRRTETVESTEDSE